MSEWGPVRMRADIAALAPYRQGRQAPAGGYKLSSNEVPFEPLQAVREAIEREAALVNRYPDAMATRLREAVAERASRGTDEVLIGAGSVTLLQYFLSAVAEPGTEVVYPWRSFEAYPGLTTVTGATGVPVPLTADGRHDLAAMAAAVTPRTRAILVCSPNNPTGPAVHEAEFRAFLAQVPRDCLVMLDEAYAEFVTDPDAVHGLALLDAHPNLAVFHTFSKAYGLAGLRVGYVFAAPALIIAAQATAMPLSVTGFATAAALASLRPELAALHAERHATVIARRTALVAGLRERGWSVPDAQGNFVWIPAGAKTEALDDIWFAAGLVTRAFAGAGIRVSVGEPEALERLLATIPTGPDNTGSL